MLKEKPSIIVLLEALRLEGVGVKDSPKQRGVCKWIIVELGMALVDASLLVFVAH
jgi:hypothetical protein